MRPRDLLRRKGTPYDELGLDDPKWADDQLIDLMLEHPVLINRPIVVTELGVKLCRPSKMVLEILPKQQKNDSSRKAGLRSPDVSRRTRMVDRLYNVLFLCTGNSARSIMAECAINRWGQGKFRGFSAGSHPKGRIHPMALRVLQRLNYRTQGLRSKSWEEFAEGRGGRTLDFVFTVCDQAAGEVCPAWPGQPMTAHWGVEDPAAFVGTEEQTYKFFRNIYGQLDNRIKIFASLPISSLDKLRLQKRIDEIGETKAERAQAS